MLCVLIRIASVRQFKCAHTTYLQVGETQRDIPIISPVLSTMFNTHWLEIPLSRTFFHGSKGIRAIEV